MKLEMLKAKIHRAPVTETRLDYEGSITIDKALCARAGIYEYEKVDVYNVNTGARFTTYALYGRKGQVCVNGAAARLAHKGDKVIIAAYAQLDESEASNHKPPIMLV